MSGRRLERTASIGNRFVAPSPSLPPPPPPLPPLPLLPPPPSHPQRGIRSTRMAHRSPPVLRGPAADQSSSSSWVDRWPSQSSYLLLLVTVEAEIERNLDSEDNNGKEEEISFVANEITSNSLGRHFVSNQRNLKT